MEPLLNVLVANLRYTCDALRGPLRDELRAQATAADRKELPGKKFAALAEEARNLLDEVNMLLQPPVETIADNFFAFFNTKCLWTAVSLNIPDLLGEGPKQIGELAALAEADKMRLNQVLRFLCGRGIFEYDASKATYSNNITSNLLLRDHWTQWWRWTDMYGIDYYDMARGLPGSMGAGCRRTAAQTHYNTDKTIFEYLQDTNQMERMLKTIAAGGLAQAPGMVQDYSWADIAASGDRLLDVGGGSGGFMATLLRTYPGLKGAVLDQENVIKSFTRYFREPEGEFADVGDRCELIVGDFFREIPPFKYYSIRWCLHDWLDEQVVQILGNIRKGIIEGPDSRLVVIEMVLTHNRAGSTSRYADVAMMVSCSGCQRNEEEWKRVVEAAGWTLARIVPLRNCWASAIELRPG